jgi:hypothetical protein
LEYGTAPEIGALRPYITSDEPQLILRLRPETDDHELIECVAEAANTEGPRVGPGSSKAETEIEAVEDPEPLFGRSLVGCSPQREAPLAQRGTSPVPRREPGDGGGTSRHQ